MANACAGWYKTEGGGRMKLSIRGAWFLASARSTAVIIIVGIAFSVHAQQPKVGELYKCSDGHTPLKVAECSGGNPSLCDIEPFTDGKPQAGMRLSSAVVNDLLRICL